MERQGVEWAEGRSREDSGHDMHKANVTVVGSLLYQPLAPALFRQLALALASRASSTMLPGISIDWGDLALLSAKELEGNKEAPCLGLGLSSDHLQEEPVKCQPLPRLWDHGARRAVPRCCASGISVFF